MKQVNIWMQVITLSVLLFSCIHDDRSDECGIYLEFIYDYNMEYADSFDPQVGVVDAFVFDADGKYLFTRHAERSRLANGKQMLLGDDLPLGTYQVLSTGGLSDHFLLSDTDGEELRPGITSIEQVKIALLTESDEVSHEFSPLWFGSVTTFENTEDRHVCPVHLIKNTNTFNLVLVKPEIARAPVQTETPAYTFEIVTPEKAEYSYINQPVVEELVSYKPYYLAPGVEPDNISVGYINTCRLFYKADYDYRLIVRDTKTQREVWNYDLMVLLAHTKPANRPDGSELPMQEYLDRQSEWNMAILYEGEVGGEGFMAIAVEVNGWVVWLRDIEI